VVFNSPINLARIAAECVQPAFTRAEVDLAHVYGGCAVNPHAMPENGLERDPVFDRAEVIVVRGSTGVCPFVEIVG